MASWRDNRSELAAVEAEERRRLLGQEAASPERRAHFGDTEGEPADRKRGVLRRFVDRIRRAPSR